MSNNTKECLNRFSGRVRHAVRYGAVPTDPLIDCIEDSARIFNGIATIVEIFEVSDLMRESQDPDQAKHAIQPGDAHVLLEMAKASARIMSARIEKLATWADDRADEHQRGDDHA